MSGISLTQLTIVDTASGSPLTVVNVIHPSFNDLQLATIGSIGYWADCTSPTSHRVYLGLSTFPVCNSGKLRFRLGSPDPKNANIPTRMSMELSNYLVSGFITYLGDL